MIWLVFIVHGVVASYLPAVDIRHCAAMRQQALVAYVEVVKPACHVGARPALDRPLPRPGVQV